MTRTEVLKNFIRSSLTFCAYEREDMMRAVESLEPKTRAGLIASYGADHAWRGLARDDFLVMIDSLEILASTVTHEV